MRERMLSLLSSTADADADVVVVAGGRVDEMYDSQRGGSGAPGILRADDDDDELLALD